MPQIIRHALLTLLVAGSSSAATQRTCTRFFNGSDFLAAASQRGLQPEWTTECHRVSITDNTFHASPAGKCELLFRHATWLVPNAKFTGAKGSGNFSATVNSDGFLIKIKAKGGFYLGEVRVLVTTPHASCSDITLDEVLGGGSPG